MSMSNIPARPPGLFRVMTYNLCFGGAERVDAIQAVIAHAAPDAAALTEADDPGVVADLAGRLGMGHVWARGSGDRHIAFLSRLPIKVWRIYNSLPLTQAVLKTELAIRQPPSAINQQPTALTLYSLHLLPYLLLPFEIHRARALGALLQMIRRDQPGPHLILGDVNAIAPGDRVLHHKNPPVMQRVMTLQANIIFRLAIPTLLRAGYVDCYRAVNPPLSPFPFTTAANEREAGGEGVNSDGFT